jgi:hypothetical protein
MQFALLVRLAAMVMPQVCRLAKHAWPGSIASKWKPQLKLHVHHAVLANSVHELLQTIHDFVRFAQLGGGVKQREHKTTQHALRVLLVASENCPVRQLQLCVNHAQQATSVTSLVHHPVNHAQQGNFMKKLVDLNVQNALPGGIVQPQESPLKPAAKLVQLVDSMM